jgi:hypothetical protein
MSLSYVNRAVAKQLSGVSYVGGVNHSAKISKNKKKAVDTYIIYLAPASVSGYNVCPMATADCMKACLHSSGQNRMDQKGKINNARITKTKLFFEDRPFFMRWVIDEIKAYKALAEKKGNAFSVRLNGTSDISPVMFKLDEKTLFEYFPDVTFYDYTKVFNRCNLLQKFKNYDLTFSYSGSNWDECEQALAIGMRIAMVFEKIPAFYKGIPVINGDETDLRYLDATNVIVGLKFKKVRTKIDFNTQSFIVKQTDKDCTY